MVWTPRKLRVVFLSRSSSPPAAIAPSNDAARALRTVAPVRLAIAAASAFALAAPAVGLVDPLGASHLAPWSAAASSAVIAVFGLVALVMSQRPARGRVGLRSHVLAAIDALGLALLVLHFGAPALVVLPLLVLLPLAVAHAASAHHVLWWSAPLFLIASEAHVRVRPLDAPSLVHVWLGALGLLGLGGFAIWQARQQRLMVRVLRDRIAARDVLASEISELHALRPDAVAGLGGDLLHPIREAIDAWRWAERSRANILDAQQRELATVRTQLLSEMDALRERTTDSAREADLLFETLSHSVRTVSEGARTARAARAAGELAATSADAVTELARRVTQNAQSGRDAVERLTRTLRVMSDDVPRVTDQARALGPLTDDVGHAVHALERLVRQSAQVALNASIEAQRAGPYGIGFGVVADELQRLATQTAAAAARITETVTETRDTVHTLTRRLERTTRASDAVEQLSATAHTALDVLLTDIAELLERTEATMRQTRAQADAAASTLLAVDGLDERIQRAAHDARRTAHALTTHVTDLHALHQVVRAFVTPTRRDARDVRTPHSSTALSTPARALPPGAPSPARTHRDVA